MRRTRRSAARDLYTLGYSVHGSLALTRAGSHAPSLRFAPLPLPPRYHYKAPSKGENDSAGGGGSSNASGQKMVAEAEGEGRTFLGGETWRGKIDQDESDCASLLAGAGQLEGFERVRSAA